MTRPPPPRCPRPPLNPRRPRPPHETAVLYCVLLYRVQQSASGQVKIRQKYQFKKLKFQNFYISLHLFGPLRTD
jgi:hypothetical protein